MKGLFMVVWVKFREYTVMVRHTEARHGGELLSPQRLKGQGEVTVLLEPSKNCSHARGAA